MYTAKGISARPSRSLTQTAPNPVPSLRSELQVGPVAEGRQLRHRMLVLGVGGKVQTPGAARTGSTSVR